MVPVAVAVKVLTVNLKLQVTSQVSVELEVLEVTDKVTTNLNQMVLEVVLNTLS